MQVVRHEGRAEGSAGVSGSGLNPDAAETAVAVDAAIGDAVEGNAGSLINSGFLGSLI